MKLVEYVAIHGQYKTANDLKVSQPAISRALQNKRNIIVTNENGEIKAMEIRPFPRKEAAANSGSLKD